MKPYKHARYSPAFAKRIPFREQFFESIGITARQFNSMSLEQKLQVQTKWVNSTHFASMKQQFPIT